MSEFDRARFAESFAAAVIGAAVVEFASDGLQNKPQRIEISKKFQRALIIAMKHPALDDAAAQRYLERIGALLERHRSRYFQLVLQPSESEFDENLTSVFIIEHSLKSDAQWKAIISAFSLDGTSDLDRLFPNVRQRADAIRARRETERQQADARREAERQQQLRLQKEKASKRLERSKTLGGRLVNWLSSL